MEKDCTNIQQLLVALQKPHRDCLYDLSSKDYKNNMKKQIIWGEIAKEIGMNKNEAQTLWKRTKVKYRAALSKENAPSGSARRPLRPIESFLIKEMDFIRPYLEDDEPRTCNATARSTSFQELFDELATDVEDLESSSSAAITTPSREPLKKKHKPNLVTTLLHSLDKIGEFQDKLQNHKQKDPFYSFLQSIIDKLPTEKQDTLKKKIIQLAMDE